MAPLISVLAALVLTFAAGIFYVLSVLERPVWPLMRDPGSSRVTDIEAREIHGTLNRFIHILPPSMMTAMSGAVLLMGAQSWLRCFDPWSTAALLVFLAQLARVALILMPRIDAVKDRPADGPARAVRTGVGELAAAHHWGLLMVVSTLLLQLVIIARDTGVG